jgi:tetratricopeptide (TPR) repeat protein
VRGVVLLLSLSNLLPAFSEQPHIQSALTAWKTAQIAFESKQYSKAIEEFRIAIEIEPTYLQAFEGLIQACRAAGLSSQTADAITKLLEITPDRSAYRLLLAQILLEQGQTKRALAQFSFVLKSEPFKADALLGFADAAQKLGMTDRANDALQRGRNNYPSDTRFKRSVSDGNSQ